MKAGKEAFKKFSEKKQFGAKNECKGKGSSDKGCPGKCDKCGEKCGK